MAAPAAWAATSPVGRRMLAIAATGAASAVLVAVVAAGGWLSSSNATTGMSNVDCAVNGVSLTGDKNTGGLGLDTDQVRNSQIIVGVGVGMGVPLKGQIVAIATALQESDLHNLDHGDLDSLGLFQQRPSAGWGSRDQIMDPQYASRNFYAHLLKVPNWQDMSVTQAAQAVQASGFPNAYAAHEQQAVQIVGAVAPSGTQQISSDGCAPVGATSSAAVNQVLNTALQQVGKPYEWGATGPDSFDCSGLVIYAWRKAGYQLNVRTSQEMYSIALPVPSGQEQPGDLVFSGWNEQGPGPGHVMMVVAPGTLVEAPHTGLDVRVRPYNATQEGLKFGRLPQNALKPLPLGG
ncbi:C40 family peptidase [Streptantibioticus ferralitis]|uniref:C40 family peptidase n=1 Tax=Streptantibioticus ferralitis TaxID=236510 RepID=A0ABT5ZAR1_9ACTN|nr:C40 family peptidase [Streptantibioticus ferralitis]MDF2260937.1 C40 family peptidase [Streptantibioticus ferralitis]